MAWAPNQLEKVLTLPGTDTAASTQVEGRLVAPASGANYQLMVYSVADRTQRLQLLSRLRGHPGVHFVELDAEVQFQAVTQPVHFELLGFPQPGSWNPLQFGCDQVPVAIIDTGVDQSHPDLSHVDFLVSRNLINLSAEASDGSGHGTHIAGLVAAQANEQAGVAGLCSSAALLNYKFLDGQGSGRISDAIAAMDAALVSGARVINASWVISAYRQSLFDSVQRADQQGVYVVAAAGNAGSNNDLIDVFPAVFSQQLKHVIAVANAASDKALFQGPGSSNYGLQTVDLAAPGWNLLSTWLQGGYQRQTGTSLAAPLVSAALAALIQQNPGYPSAAYRAALVNSLRAGEAADFERFLKYPGTLDVLQLLKGAEAEVFRPAWFNYWWLEGVPVLNFQGYRLDEVTDAWMIFAEGNRLPVQLVRQEPGSLQVELPANWQEGELVFELAGDLGRLQPINFALMDSGSSLFLDFNSIDEIKTLPSEEKSYELEWCEEEVCSTDYYGYPLKVTREEYSASQQGAWAIGVKGDGDEKRLLIYAEDFSDSWSFFIGTQGRDRFVGLAYQKNEGEWADLTAADGYSQLSPRHANWVLTEASGHPYAVSSAVGEQLTLRPVITAAGSSSCFIATQVYGDPQAPQVEALRGVRDEWLMHSLLGRWLVARYYELSPALVDWMQDKPRLQALVRWGLDGLIAVLNLKRI